MNHSFQTQISVFLARRFPMPPSSSLVELQKPSGQQMPMATSLWLLPSNPVEISSPSGHYPIHVTRWKLPALSLLRMQTSTKTQHRALHQNPLQHRSQLQRPNPHSSPKLHQE